MKYKLKNCQFLSGIQNNYRKIIFTPVEKFKEILSKKMQVMGIAGHGCRLKR